MAAAQVLHEAGQFEPEIMAPETQKQVTTDETLAYQQGEAIETREPHITMVVKG